MKKRSLGRHLVIDPAVHQGTPVFRGTRIAVADVLERVARNEPWEAIVADSGGTISTEAITEAIRLAGAVFLEHARVPPRSERDVPPTVYGAFVIADPGICHGTPTFRGTRIFVADVVDQVADGLAWDTIVAEWRHSIGHVAIAQAIRVASRYFARYARDYSPQPALP